MHKLERMKQGETVVVNDAEFDAMLAAGDDAAYEVRSLPNPKRVGINDVYVAWIGEPRASPKAGELA